MPTNQSRKSRMKKSAKVGSVTPDDRIIDFMKFAPEIRNNVYDHICVKPSYIGSNGGLVITTKQFYKDAASWRNLGFATSCKQIYIESSHVFYSRNGFEFCYIRSLLEFLEAIGLGGRTLLTKLRILYERSGTPFIALRYLKSCKNLQELEVYITGARQAGFPLLQPLQFFLGNLTKIEFGDHQSYGTEVKYSGPPVDFSSPEIHRRKSLTESLEKIKNGEDGKWKGRNLPDVFAEHGRSLAYRVGMVPILKKSEEEEAKKEKKKVHLKEIEDLLKELRDFNTKSNVPGNDNSRPDPRQAMVVFGQPPSDRTVSDDQGIDFLGFPREIRDGIYSFVFIKTRNIGGETKFTKPFYNDVLNLRTLDFAGTCRQIWNDSLKTYIVHNGFEFFFMRPSLEFFEKIGIAGQRLLQKIRWHHHKWSNPFIVLRLFRSCEHLRELEIFARVTIKNRTNFWWGVPLLNAKKFFLTNCSRIEFGAAQAFGKGAKATGVVPDLKRKLPYGEWAEASLRSLDSNLRKVKWEMSGSYRRICENGMCQWKCAVTDQEKVKKRRAEKKREREEENAAAQTSLTVRETGGADEEDEEEEEEEDDGYKVSNGNLLKDRIVVASGHEFEAEDDNMMEGDDGIRTGGTAIDAVDNDMQIEGREMVSGGALGLHEHQQ
ncbi:hypothetical protein P7C71_g5252, partial [Lecanoromycetidae sp. Uapishka_2]